MRSLTRSCLVGLLAAGLIQSPVWGSSSPTLGIVVQASDATLGTTAALSGATVFARDTLATGPAGSLRLSVGGGQLYLPASSALTLADSFGGVAAIVTRGSVDFASTADHAIALQALDAIIRPTTAEPTHGQVTMLGPNSLLVTSFRGSLAVEVDGEIFLAPAGTTHRLKLEADPQQPAGAGAKRAKHRYAAWIFLGGAIAAGLAAFIACRAAEACGATVSPTKP